MPTNKGKKPIKYKTTNKIPPRFCLCVCVCVYIYIYIYIQVGQK